ncbi:hypothetical protein IGB42_01766 [Andreprevotia sp. IGB-42]|nr:hypothetical protein IGB42_01766 [Andreprevotia sp. IGB-42]
MADIASWKARYEAMAKIALSRDNPNAIVPAARAKLMQYIMEAMK